MAKSIDVSDLDIYYGDFLAVQGVNMTIKARSVTAFIGPSGCGKSTMLRSLNRMHEVIPGARVEGKIMVDGQSLYDHTIDPVAVRRQIGMVFQRPNPFPTMSIYDNVLAGNRLNSKRMKKAEADGIVEKSLRSANLWTEVKDRLNKPGMGLSGGQQQRLCIARAIAVEPQVLLMDEPCSALDPISTSAIEDLIHELKADYTIVIVTHNMQQAARVSDDTGFFNLKAAGQPGHLVEFNADQEDVQQPGQRGHRGLHLRPLRLSEFPARLAIVPDVLTSDTPYGGSQRQGLSRDPGGAIVPDDLTSDTPYGRSQRQGLSRDPELWTAKLGRCPAGQDSGHADLGDRARGGGAGWQERAVAGRAEERLRAVRGVPTQQPRLLRTEGCRPVSRTAGRRGRCLGGRTGGGHGLGCIGVARVALVRRARR